MFMNPCSSWPVRSAATLNP